MSINRNALDEALRRHPALLRLVRNIKVFEREFQLNPQQLAAILTEYRLILLEREKRGES